MLLLPDRHQELQHNHQNFCLKYDLADALDAVKETANTNAAKVDQADDDGGIAERKAMRDKNRIESRASVDADRTEKRAEKSMDAVKNAVNNIKDAFSK